MFTAKAKSAKRRQCLLFASYIDIVLQGACKPIRQTLSGSLLARR